MIKFEPFPSALLRAIVFSVVLLFQFALRAELKSEGRILNNRLHHLGNDSVEITPGASLEPEGTRFDVTFQTKNKNEATLALTYWDINDPTVVEINEQKIGVLPVAKNRAMVYLRIPDGVLRKGENRLSIVPKATDDCVIGQIVLHEQPFREVMQLETVHITVKDSKTGKATPALITITDTNGKSVPIFLSPDKGTAVRTGLIYVSGKETKIELHKGDYVFYATRGMEWSRDKQLISVTADNSQKAKFQLRREVDTTGYIAADTHIHTLTFSGHGDASVEERMVTLAGEGVELAVATDHNHHTDYRPYQKELGLNSYFTPVVGNEVTTKFGHINGFPMPRDGVIPDKTETNWVKLVGDIRFRGAKVVILNHPRWGRSDVFAGLKFNSLTGKQAAYDRLPFDGVELINFGVAETGPLERFAEWFALLNHGENIKAVGSSDSHTVAAPVGQGRTYLRSSTDNPAKIKIDEACANFLSGHSSISLGIFADVWVNERFKAGDLVPTKTGEVRVKFRVAAPSWVTPRRALVFLNGIKVAEQALHPDGSAMNEEVEFTIPAPRHDAHLVCVALGDNVSEPHWRARGNFTVAATNPVFLDADNDGSYRSPNDTAKMILARTAKTLDAQWNALGSVDDSIAVQLLSLIYNSADSVTKSALQERLRKDAGSRPVFGKFLELAAAPSNLK